MGELMDTILAALQEAGIPAVREFPMEAMPHLTRAAAAAGLQSIRGESGGFADYLGVFEDPALGSVERYGKRLTVTLLCRIYAPRGELAAAGAETVCALLTSGIPGLRARTFTVGDCAYDGQADCCTVDVTATVIASFYAAMPMGEEPTLEDFRLESE